MMVGPIGGTAVTSNGGAGGGGVPPAIRGAASSVGIGGSSTGLVLLGAYPCAQGQRDAACWHSPRTAYGSSARGCAPSAPKVPQNAAHVTCSKRTRTQRHMC